MYKHLTIEQRILIEDRLNHHTSIRGIAKELEISPSTVLREITRSVIIDKPTGNECKHRKNCMKKGLCNEPYCNRRCALCTFNCNRMCGDFEAETCPKKNSPNDLCNGCSSLYHCTHERRRYKASEAEKRAKELLVTSRSGFDLTLAEIERINELASPMIKNGASPYHIKETYKEELPVSESTLRRMIDGCELDARNVDLREKVKRKPRESTKNKNRNKQLSLSKVGHFYADYLNYVETNDIHTTEMDCVEGVKSESESLLTLTLKELSLQLAFIMECQDCENVVKTLDKVEEILGSELFRKTFPVILTDNGSEFCDIDGMERSINGGRRTKIFFCDPNRSDQKGTCENHHKMIRYVIPKGTSLKPYNQSDVSLMMNHINSYKRKALFGKSAYEMAESVLDEDFFVLLGLESIPPEKIILTPKLISP